MFSTCAMCMSLYIPYGQKYSPRENFANFATGLHGWNFYPANFLSCINDYTEDMATFTALAKIYSSEYFCNARVAGIGEILSSEKFHLHSNITYLFMQSKFGWRLNFSCGNSPRFWRWTQEDTMIMIHTCTIAHQPAGGAGPTPPWLADDEWKGHCETAHLRGNTETLSSPSMMVAIYTNNVCIWNFRQLISS